jgi:cysteine desulfurase
MPPDGKPAMTDRAYLDHNATAPVRPEVVAAVADVLGRVGNASSVHAEGRAARTLIETARERVAALVGASPADVIFTSGGTEADNLALRPGALLDRTGVATARLAFPATEHAAVLTGHGFGSAAREIAVEADGGLDLRALRLALAETGEASGRLVSVQFANSETGVLQPLGAVASLAAERGFALHVDAVQAAGRVPIDMTALGIDAVSLSGHKLGAPMGVGALVVAPGRAGPGLRLVAGGGQERGIRGGTENLPGIVGFGIAAEVAARDLLAEAARLRALRDGAEREVRRLAPDAVIFGDSVERLPNTVAFAVPGIDAQTALMALDLDGVAVSSGSACSSGRVGRSHVLAAMGVPSDLAAGAIRLSFGWNSTREDISRFSRSFETLVRRLYKQRDARAA